jgi:hypothetical protein
MSSDSWLHDYRPPFDATWSVVVFSSRESIDTLASSVEAALTATIDKHAVTDGIVNGNRTLADAAGRYVGALQTVGKAAKLVQRFRNPPMFSGGTHAY